MPSVRVAILASTIEAPDNLSVARIDDGFLDSLAEADGVADRAVGSGHGEQLLGLGDGAGSESRQGRRSEQLCRRCVIEAGEYRNLTGNTALALGIVAAGVQLGRPVFLGAYPITPASDVLHEVARHRNFGVKTFQAEDEIAAASAAIGASFAGHLAVCCSSGPGFVLKQEALGLAVMVELPLVVVDVQRAGPATGSPTISSALAEAVVSIVKQPSVRLSNENVHLVLNKSLIFILSKMPVRIPMIRLLLHWNRLEIRVLHCGAAAYFTRIRLH